MFSLLNRLGLDNLLQEVMSEERSSSRAAAENGGGDGGDDTKPDNSDSDDDYDRKSDNAVDYSDINELADDMPVCFFFVFFYGKLFNRNVYALCSQHLRRAMITMKM